MNITSWKTKTGQSSCKRDWKFQSVKRVIDNLKTESAKNKNEIISANKALKVKDKEIYNSEKKSDNQNDTICRQKVEIKNVKDELKGLRKRLKTRK